MIASEQSYYEQVQHDLAWILPTHPTSAKLSDSKVD